MISFHAITKADSHVAIVKTTKCKQAVTIAFHSIVITAVMTSVWQYQFLFMQENFIVSAMLPKIGGIKPEIGAIKKYY